MQEPIQPYKQVRFHKQAYDLPRPQNKRKQMYFSTAVNQVSYFGIIHYSVAKEDHFCHSLVQRAELNFMGNLIFQWKKTNYPCLDIIQSNIFVLQTTKDTLTRYWSSRVSFISAEAPSKKFMRLINFQHRSSELSKPRSLSLVQQKPQIAL